MQHSLKPKGLISGLLKSEVGNEQFSKFYVINCYEENDLKNQMSINQSVSEL